MSHLSCILCGLQKPLSARNMEDNDLDIYLISKRGLGRGRGWDDTRESVLGDEVYTPAIKERVLEIIKHFMSEGIITEEELDEITKEKSESEKDNILISSNIIGLAIKNQEIMKYKKDVDKLNSNYYLQEKVDKLNNKNKKTVKSYERKFNVHKSVEFAISTILKYLKCSIIYGRFGEYKVVITDLDYNFECMFFLLNNLLNKEEWFELMKKVEGVNVRIQSVLDKYTYIKKTLQLSPLNRGRWFERLFMFKNHLDIISLF